MWLPWGLVDKPKALELYHTIFRRDELIKTYCKNVDITDPFVIEPWVSLCISDPKKRNRPGFKRLVDRYGDAHGIAVEITERIKPVI